MAGNIYAKVDCYNCSLTNTNFDYEQAGVEPYVQTFNFLSYLSGNNIVDLVTYFTGSSALGTGTDYWDTSNSIGKGAFSVWKWKANSDRNWDWYLMIQATSGSTNLNVNANCTPTVTQLGNSTFFNIQKGLLIQSAICVSGSASLNPWNGTISMGNAAKGNPVWSTASNPNATVHVFPRVNNLSGSDATAKSTMMTTTRETTTNYGLYYRIHYFADSDSFMIAYDIGTNFIKPVATYAITYFGPYKLAQSISQSNLQNTLGQSGKYGFMAYGMGPNAASKVSTTLTTYGNIGPVTWNSNVPDGGILATTDLGVRQYNMACESAYLDTTYQPNAALSTTTKYFDERQIDIILSETPFYGFVGFLDTPIIRLNIGMQSHHVKYGGSNASRVVFGGATAMSNMKISTVWSGSHPPGAYNGSRDGYMFMVPSSSII